MLLIICMVMGLSCALVAGYLLWQRQEEAPEVLFFPDSKLPCNSFYMKLEGRTFPCPRANCHFAHHEREETSLMRIFVFLKQAEKSIDLCIFEFTLTPLADFLIEAHTRGIQVRVITDSHATRQSKIEDSAPAATSLPANNNVNNSHKGNKKANGPNKTNATSAASTTNNTQLAHGFSQPSSAGDSSKLTYNDQIPRLQTAGIRVKVNKPDGYALMHNKFALVDGKSLIMGSFNWTKSAVLKNHEAVIMTSDSRIVEKFVDKFAEIWKVTSFRKRNVDMVSKIN